MISRQLLGHLSHVPKSFVTLIIFQGEPQGLVWCQPWTTVLLPMPSVWLRSQIHATMSSFLVEMRVSLFFGPGWPRTMILLMSPRIKDLRYYSQTQIGLFWSPLLYLSAFLHVCFYANNLLFVVMVLEYALKGIAQDHFGSLRSIIDPYEF
jgi:hypothetical protein